MAPLAATHSHAGGSARPALQRVGLVVCEIGNLIVGVHIPNVARVMEGPYLVACPCPRPDVRSLMRVDTGLVPLLDIGDALGIGPTSGDARYVVLVQDKDSLFGFPANSIESVMQIRADRVHFPRTGEVAVDHELLRGYWKFSARRNGYILHCSRLYHKIVGEPRKTELASSEIEE